MRLSSAGCDVNLVVAAMVVAGMAAAPDAQRRRDATPETLPLATDTVTADPDAYYGKKITLSAGIDEVLSKTAFTVDQRRLSPGSKAMTTIGKPILVIAPTLNGTLDTKNYMLLVGELVKFDAAEIARKAAGYTLDLTPDVIGKYQGRPALLATAVIDSQYVDQAKRPMTSEETALSLVMRRVSTSFTALRRAVDDANAGQVKQHATLLKAALVDSQAFWKQRGDAAVWAAQAQQQAESIERDAADGTWDAVKATATNVGTACQRCHNAYRDRLDDGTFRIRSGK